MRKFLLASAAAVALFAAPAQVKADISFGELEDALTDFGTDLLTVLVDILLSPFNDLPIPSVPVALPAPITTHVLAEPVSVSAAATYMQDRLAERTARIDQMDEVTAMVTGAAATDAAQLAALAVANAAPPTSIAAGQQVGNMATIAAANAVGANTQVLAGMAALDADRALREEREKWESFVAAMERNPGGVWLGQRQWTPEKIKRSW